jgi:hypothetical protein
VTKRGIKRSVLVSTRTYQLLLRVPMQRAGVLAGVEGGNVPVQLVERSGWGVENVATLTFLRRRRPMWSSFSRGKSPMRPRLREPRRQIAAAWEGRIGIWPGIPAVG